MEVGVCLPNAGSKATPENIMAIARQAEKLGFHSVWVTDHVVLPEKVESYYPYRANGRWDYSTDTNWLDPLLTLCWVQAAAPSLKLGTSVLVAPLRNPILLAKQLATLDYLSGGRVILGAGAGWMEEEFNLIGTSFADRGKRVLEMVKLMRAFWTGETVHFEGKTWQIHDCMMYPTPVNRSIPVVWGGHTEAALKRVARMGDGWHPTQITLEQLRNGITQLRQLCTEYDRDPASVMVINRPGNTYKITAETQAIHVELGIDHLVCDTPIHDSGLQDLFEEMQRIAEICGLQPRS